MQNIARSVVATVVLALGCASAASAGDLKLSINGGRATIIAQDVPLRQILAEWERIGQTKIVNGDKLIGPPLTLQLVDRPEREVLDVLLRQASGYIAAARPTVVANTSQFDRVMILAVSRGPVGSAVASSPAPQPFQRVIPPTDDDEPIEPSVINNQPVLPPGAPPLPGQYAPPQQPSQPGQAQPVLTAPRPGMLPAPPTTAPNPYAPGNQNQPQAIRPPGGGL